jgi:hypothetical protein
MLAVNPLWHKEKRRLKALAALPLRDACTMLETGFWAQDGMLAEAGSRHYAQCHGDCRNGLKLETERVCGATPTLWAQRASYNHLPIRRVPYALC